MNDDGIVLIVVVIAVILAIVYAVWVFTADIPTWIKMLLLRG